MLLTQVRRTFQRRVIQVIIIGLLILLSSMVFSMMYFSANTATDAVYEYLDEQNQEDLSINVSTMLTPTDIDFLENNATSCSGLSSTSLRQLMIENNDCYYQLTDHRGSLIESNYLDTNIQYREIKKQKLDNGHLVYFVGVNPNNNEINIPYFENGVKPQNANEIALTQYYMDSNDLVIGDKIAVNDIEYTITANVMFPDITLGSFDSADALDLTKTSFAYIPYNEFKSMIYFETLNMYYSADIGDYDIKSTEIKDYVSNFNETVSTNAELDFVINAVSVLDTMRTGAIVADLDYISNVSIYVSTIIAGFAVAIVAIIVAQIIKKERTQIGVLKALGFSKRSIIRPYMILLGVYSLILLLVGLLIGGLLAPIMMGFLRSAYMIPTFDVTYSLLGVTLAVLIPLVIILVSAYILLNVLLRKEALEMIHPEEKKQNFIVRLLSKKNSDNVKRKFKVMITLSSLPKLGMYLFTIMVASFMMLLGFSTKVGMDAVATSINSTDYEQTAYVSPAVTDLDALYAEILATGEVEKAIELEITVEGHGSSPLLALDNESNLYEVYDDKGNSLSDSLTGNEVVISYGYHKINDVNKGDTILVNLSIDKSIEVIVKDISASYDIGETIYMNRESLSNELTGTTNYYNKVYSDENVSLDDNTKFIGLITKDEIIDMNEKMSGFKEVQAYVMIILSFVLGFAFLYLIVGLIIEENFYNISLLKVLGFKKKEVNSIVLTGLFLLSIVLFALAIPFVLKLIDNMEQATIEMGNFTPMTISPIHILISLVLILVVFLLVSLNAARKMEKISLQESLKLYQD